VVGRLTFLLDSSIWLELLLDQEKAADVRQLLEIHESEALALTEFSLYSIAIVLTRLDRHQVLLDFLTDTVVDSGVRVIRLDVAGLQKAVGIQRQFRLDFDDAYQYTAAEQNGMILVSFDSHFDYTARGRKTPSELIAT
jgi:predicted nucleic acid-binding protein